MVARVLALGACGVIGLGLVGFWCAFSFFALAFVCRVFCFSDFVCFGVCQYLRLCLTTCLKFAFFQRKKKENLLFFFCFHGTKNKGIAKKREPRHLTTRTGTCSNHLRGNDQTDRSRRFPHSKLLHVKLQREDERRRGVCAELNFQFSQFFWLVFCLLGRGVFFLALFEFTSSKIREPLTLQTHSFACVFVVDKKRPVESHFLMEPQNKRRSLTWVVLLLVCALVGAFVVMQIGNGAPQGAVQVCLLCNCKEDEKKKL